MLIALADSKLNNIGTCEVIRRQLMSGLFNFRQNRYLTHILGEHHEFSN